MNINIAELAVSRRLERDAAKPAKPAKPRVKKIKTPDLPYGDRIFLEFAGLPPIAISRDTAIERFKRFNLTLENCREITVYLNPLDLEDRTTVKPANLNRAKTAFESGTFGDRENAIASNKRDSIALTPRIPYILNDKIVRSVFIDGVCAYGTIGQLQPVNKIERRSRSSEGTKRLAHRTRSKAIAPIAFDKIGDRRLFTDKRLGPVAVWIDARSKRLTIETATGRFYAHIAISPIRSVVWQSTDRRYADIVAYHNVLSGYYVAEKSIDRVDTPTQRSVNTTAPIPSCLMGYKIEIERDRLVARSVRSVITIATLQNMDLGHAVTVDRRLWNEDGTIAKIAVDDKFWSNLTKITNGVYGTIANSDRRYASKQKSMIKSIAKTIAIVDGSHRLLTDIERKAIADRFAHMANRSGFNTIHSIVTLCSQARSPDNPDHDRAIVIFNQILKMTKA